jgi:hypothetical protein
MTLNYIFAFIGKISTAGMIIGFCYTAYLVVRGVIPVWYRLGIGLSKAQIAIFTESKYNDLKDMIVDSMLRNFKTQLSPA